MFNLKNIALFVLGVALVAFSGIVNASTYVGIGTSDFFFEVYSGNSYAYAAVPYTYAYSGYYYFDYPYRVYSAGTYNYYDAGWYNFDPYWSTASTFCATCYSYYSPSYYFYDNYWNYAPGWVGTYGPQYYGSYYMAPNQATLVGQSYKPVHDADCSQIEITAGSFTLLAGEKTSATFYIKNRSTRKLDVGSASVFVDGSAVSISNTKFDSTIASGSTGKVTFDAKAQSNAMSETLDGRIKVGATFGDGTYCSPTDAQQDFEVSVYKNSSSKLTPEHYQSQVQGSASYLVAKETQQNWEQVDTAKYSNYGSNTNNYNNNYQNDNRQRIVTDYGQTQFAQENCSDLSIVAQNVSLDSDETKTVYYTIKNFGSEDFSLDSMEGIEYSPDFSMAVTRDSGRIYAGGNGALKVQFSASDVSRDSTGTAYIKAYGHYNSGLGCDVISDNFYVRVNGENRANVSDITLDSPVQVKMNGSGFITFYLTNPSEEEVTVSAYSNEVVVSPSAIKFAAGTEGVRTVAVNGFDGTQATVYLKVGTKNGDVVTKFVKIVKGSGTNTVPNTGTGTNANTSGGLGGIISTGFATLSGNGFLLGLVLVALIGGAIFIAYRAEEN